MTAYDGQPFAYEGQSLSSTGTLVYGTAISGNPVSYYNGTRWTFGWKKGRQLVSASGNGKIITYTYDMAGIRDSKTVDGVTYHYDTLNGKVVRQTWTEGTTEHVFEIVYDASGLPYSCVYNGSRYYYVLNQQGDVIRIVGYLGATLCEYQYDAWGNVLAITGTYKDTIGKVNPIRYCGYYYDTDTGFYYLQSRYYDPSIGRFINADQFASTGQDFLGYNMFAYCNNNPVVGFDPSGHFDLIGAAAGFLVGAALSITSYLLSSGGDIELGEVISAGVVGGISGVAASISVTGALVAGAINGVYTYCTSEGTTLEKSENAIFAMVTTAAGGALAFTGCDKLLKCVSATGHSLSYFLGSVGINYVVGQIAELFSLTGQALDISSNYSVNSSESANTTGAGTAKRLPGGIISKSVYSML